MSSSNNCGPPEARGSDLRPNWGWACQVTKARKRSRQSISRGVGNTTVTWCLADTLSTYSNATVLMFDLDNPQGLHVLMSISVKAAPQPIRDREAAALHHVNSHLHDGANVAGKS